MTFREIAFGTAEYALERRLREEILREPLGLSLSDEDLAGEENQLHFGLFEPENRLAACAIAAPVSRTEARIRQMAVSASQQRKGLGRRLMTELEQDLQARGFRKLTLEARTSAVGFYEKLGYAVVGDGFVKLSIPHARMVKGLPDSPRAEASVPFDFQPTLRGELVLLRPLRVEDFDDLYAVSSDPLIWEQHPARDRYRKDVFERFFGESLNSGGALLTLDARDGRVIGSSRFQGYDSQRSEIEIGWTFLARSHWGGRYNAEMKRLMLRHAFRFVESVVFLVTPQNRRSRRAIEKLGAVRVGSRPDAGGRDSLLFRITSSELAPDGRS
jgi:N-acetyltransferase